MVSLNNPKNNTTNGAINSITSTGLESEDDLSRGNLIFSIKFNYNIKLL